MIDHRTIESIRQKYSLLRAELDERARRCWAAAEALALGYGGISAVAQATALARNTIAAGIREAQARTPRTQVFVSRGVGTVGLPLRSRRRPEVNLLTLARQE